MEREIFIYANPHPIDTRYPVAYISTTTTKTLPRIHTQKSGTTKQNNGNNAIIKVRAKYLYYKYVNDSI